MLPPETSCASSATWTDRCQGLGRRALGSAHSTLHACQPCPVCAGSPKTAVRWRPSACARWPRSLTSCTTTKPKDRVRRLSRASGGGLAVGGIGIINASRTLPDRPRRVHPASPAPAAARDADPFDLPAPPATPEFILRIVVDRALPARRAPRFRRAAPGPPLRRAPRGAGQ